MSEFFDDFCTDPAGPDPQSNIANLGEILNKVELIKEDYPGKSIFTRHCEAEQCTIKPVKGEQGNNFVFFYNFPFKFDFLLL